MSWNKGLTKETDERLKKFSERMKGNKRGIGHKSWNKGLTKETDERLKKFSEKLKKWCATEEGKKHLRTISILGANAIRGKPSKNRGKKATPKQLENLKLGCQTRTAKRRLSAINNLRKRRTIISVPQQKLYLYIKQFYSDAKLEYPIKTNETIRFADIGVPSQKIDFEYDGFHSFNHHTPDKDRLRDLELLKVGWMTTRFDEKTMENIKLTPELEKQIGIIAKKPILLACNTRKAKKKAWETRRKNNWQPSEKSLKIRSEKLKIFHKNNPEVIKRVWEKRRRNNLSIHKL